MFYAELRLPLVLVSLCVGSAAAAEPVRVAGPGHQPRQPQAAISADGTAYLVWGEGDSIQAARWEAHAAEPGRSVRVGEVAGLMLGMRRGPRVAVAGKTVTVTAIGREGGVLAWHSPDGAQSWEGPFEVNDQRGSGREGLHDLAAGPAGELYCVWLDLRNSEMELWGARSDDGGRTWKANFLIYRSPDGHICECCHPSVECDADGSVYVMWRNWLGGARDMYLNLSRDGGRSFRPAEKLGAGSWPLDHCPMDGGHLAVIKPGAVSTIWRRGHEIFATRGGKLGEQRLGVGEQPWAAGSEDGAWLAWISGRPGDLWILGPRDEQPTRLAQHASDPVLAAPLAGRGPVVAVWEAGAGKTREIRAAVISPRKTGQAAE